MPFLILKIAVVFAAGYVTGNPAVINTIKSKLSRDTKPTTEA